MWDVYQDLDEEMKKQLEAGATVLLPDMNRSMEGIALVDGEILLGFRNIRGVTEKVAKSIVSERSKGPYLDLEDFLRRVSALHRRSSEVNAMIMSGCFDCFSLSRQSLLSAFENPSLFKRLDAYWGRIKQASLGIDEVLKADDAQPLAPLDLSKYLDPVLEDDSEKELSEMEREVLQPFPYELQIYPYKKAMKLLRINRIDLGSLEKKESKATKFLYWGRIRRVETNEITRGRDKGALRVDGALEDSSGIIAFRITMKKREFAKKRIVVGALTEIAGHIRKKSEPFLTADSVRRLPSPKELINTMVIRVSHKEITPVKIHHLKAILTSFPGIDSVGLTTTLGDRELAVKLPVRVNSKNVALRSLLYETFDRVEIAISFDDDLI